MSLVTLYLVHHPKCDAASRLSREMFDWFRLSFLSGAQSGAGIPVYFRREIEGYRITPSIDYRGANLNVIVLLVDEQIVFDPAWRAAVVTLTEEAQKAGKGGKTDTLILPIALHDSFYRMGPIYDGFNSIRLLSIVKEEPQSFLNAVASLRRNITESMARNIRNIGGKSAPPLKIFLSHAKRDGREVAEAIRDDIRSIGQFEAWYDANDLPYGKEWDKPMRAAVSEDTAAMIAVRTDAYPSRPWCRREASLARSPLQIGKTRVWRIQPTVAVDLPGRSWSGSIPMLAGVPRIGWDPTRPKETTESVVDRLVLEVLIGLVHRDVATKIIGSQKMRQTSLNINKTNSCFVTWVPDVWTLACVRSDLKAAASKIEYIVFPGYGLTGMEKEELRPVLDSFQTKTQLISFEEVMS